MYTENQSPHHHQQQCFACHYSLLLMPAENPAADTAGTDEKPGSDTCLPSPLPEYNTGSGNGRFIEARQTEPDPGMDVDDKII